VRKIPYRASLPIIFGLTALALISWGFHADYACRFDDSWRPFWRCEAPNFLLSAINAPAVVCARLLTYPWMSSPLYDLPFHLNYFIELPAIVLWWWFVGTRIDFGLLGIAYRRRRTWIAVTTGAAIALAATLAWSISEEVTFHKTFATAGSYGFLRFFGDVRSLPLYIWLIILISAFGAAAFRLICKRVQPPPVTLISRRGERVSAFILSIYVACVCGYFAHEKTLERQIQAEYDLHSIIVRGKVIDDRGVPIKAIGVDLVPMFKTGDIQSYEAVHDWTNDKGEYTLRPEEAGNYFLAVLWNAAPDHKHPFLTRYYPDEATQEGAATLTLTAERHLDLAPMKLRELPVVRVPVLVVWSNGKLEPDATVSFTNMLYPRQGAIGYESRQPDDDGKMSLPANFDYAASAGVECDGGQSIHHAYSRPVDFTTKPGGLPTEPVRLVLLGEPCTVWHPK
jgi:putative flippase GtrA